MKKPSIFHNLLAHVRNFGSVALIAGILIAVLLSSTLWFLKTSQNTTENAVYAVSELYLHELTEQRVNQFHINQNSQIQQMQAATQTMLLQDIQTEEAMQQYLGRIKEANRFDYFCLVDDQGCVYTDSGITHSSADFIDLEITGSSNICLGQSPETEHMVLTIIPAESFLFNGRKLIAVAAGIDIDALSEELSFPKNSTDIFCEIVMRNGDYVIKTYHDHILASDNLFSALEQSATFINDSSLERFMQDVASGRSGIVTYNLANVLHYTYYMPIEGTNSFMKTTIHYDLVSRNVDVIRTTLIRNSMLQLALIMFVLFLLFGIYTSMRRRNSILHLEKIQAEERSMAKSTFLSNMSHDIRTPMNAIIGFTNLAIKCEDDIPKLRGYLNKILASSNHLLALINDVLEMSRIESGKITLDETECNLPEVLHDLNTIILGQIQSKQQELLMDAVDITDEDVYCDKLRLNQVLLNLLSNAIKFTPAGGKISVRLEQKPGAPEGYGAYELRVKDNGIGMSPEFAKRLFTPFERERNSTISGIQGTGLGMAITKNILDLMGGSIRVITAPDKGTEFIIEVNLRLQAHHKETELPVRFEGVRALVVDDDFDACDAATRMLLKLGMQPEWTLSGKEAILRTKQALLLNDAFGVYIIDWHLPDLGGVEVARQIRTLVGSDAPILVMTAYDWSDIEHEARAAGVNVFCGKPLFMSTLRAALSKAIGQQAAQKESTKEPEAQRISAGERILLVEDNELNREIAREILTEDGFELDEAENGSVAVQMLQKAGAGYYDLILMDIQMPVMDGYTATRTIRALEDKALASIPIVAMTANAFAEDVEAAKAAGMDGHIAKPIDVDLLKRTLAELFKKP